MSLQKPEGSYLTEEAARAKARRFVKGSATFQYDGYDLTYQERSIPTSLDVSIATPSFLLSRQAGYGDRSGEMVAQVSL